MKESFIVYSLLVSGLSNCSQNLASLLVGVPIADKIGQNDGIPSSVHWSITGFFCVEYGVWINSATHCNFSVPVYCTY